MTGITPEKITADLLAMGITSEPAAHREADAIVAESATTPEEEVVVEVEDTTDVSKIETEAAAKGWKPGGPKSAEEFIRAEPLYDEIKTRGREIKELKATIDEMKALMYKKNEMESHKLKMDLEAAKINAIRIGDVESVQNIDTELHEYNKITQKQETPKQLVEVEDFLARNKAWITDDPSYEAEEMRTFAKKRDHELVAFNLSPDEHLRVIEGDLKAKYPHRFGNTTTSTPGSARVESDTHSAQLRSKKKVGFNDLSSEQKQCARHFEKRGIMTVEAYIKSLIELGELK